MFKEIVVCVNDAKGADNTIRAAASFANHHNASLTGLYMTTSDVPIMPPFGPTFEPALIEAIEREVVKTDQAKENFLKIVNSLNCSATWYEVGSGSDPLKAIIYADLVITNQDAYDPRLGRSNHGFINNLILETGKPVILIPVEWDQPLFATKILLGWDESKEASRTIRDAMTLLQQAEHVDVVSVDYEEIDGISDVSQIASFLTQRNVSNQFHLQITDKDLDTPEKVLLDNAKKNASNLIVIGGYGHTRLREIILGGTTRYLIKHSSVPLFLSH